MTGRRGAWSRGVPAALRAAALVCAAITSSWILPSTIVARAMVPSAAPSNRGVATEQWLPNGSMPTLRRAATRLTGGTRRPSRLRGRRLQDLGSGRTSRDQAAYAARPTSSSPASARTYAGWSRVRADRVRAVPSPHRRASSKSPRAISAQPCVRSGSPRSSRRAHRPAPRPVDELVDIVEPARHDRYGGLEQRVPSPEARTAPRTRAPSRLGAFEVTQLDQSLDHEIARAPLPVATLMATRCSTPSWATRRLRPTTGAQRPCRARSARSAPRRRRSHAGVSALGHLEGLVAGHEHEGVGEGGRRVCPGRRVVGGMPARPSRISSTATGSEGAAQCPTSPGYATPRRATSPARRCSGQSGGRNASARPASGSPRKMLYLSPSQ